MGMTIGNPGGRALGGCGRRAVMMAARGGAAMMFGKSLVMAIALAVLPGWATAAASAAPQTFTDAFTPEDCGLLKLQVRDTEPACGFVSVPLRHGDTAYRGFASRWW